MDSTIHPISSQIHGQENMGQENRQQELSLLASNLNSKLRFFHDQHLVGGKAQQTSITTRMLFEDCSEDERNEDDEAEDEDDVEDGEYDKMSQHPPSLTEDEKRQLLFQQRQKRVTEAERQVEPKAEKNKRMSVFCS